jgi:hypothetical protein
MGLGIVGLKMDMCKLIKRECDTCKWLESQKDALQHQDDQDNLEENYREIGAVISNHRQVFHTGENK